MSWDKRQRAYNDTHLRLQERKGVGYAASIIAEISPGQEVFVWFHTFGCQLISNLDITSFITTWSVDFRGYTASEMRMII
jgi:hypothetical protein